MIAKEYLKQVRNLDKLINAKISELDELEKQITSLHSVTLGDKVQSSSSGDSLQRTIDKIIDMRAEINGEIDRLVDLKAVIRNQLNSLNDNRYIAVMVEYYINGKTFEKIAENMHYSNRQIIRIHGNALQKFRELFKMS